MKNLRVILISGLSGSGKTTAIKALEDIGFYCVDNLPVPLLSKFLELCAQSAGRVSKVAVVEDIRGYPSYPSDPGAGDSSGTQDFIEDSRKILQDLQRENYQIEVLFLDASDTVLMRRYSETRRQHPLAIGGSIRDGIRLERERLQGIREMATRVIDTTDFNVHRLKDEIQQYAQEETALRRMSVTLLSFGYSFGIPYEADLLLDVRFLPNPYFVEELKRLRGDDSRIANYVLQWEEAKEFLRRIQEFIRFLLPLYEREGKSQLTIGIGCTGGKHRSVVIVNELAKELGQGLPPQGAMLFVRHRDVEKG